MARNAVGALVVALSLGATACGGEQVTTRADLVKQADEICARADKDTSRVMARLGAAVKSKAMTNDEALAQYRDRVIATQRRSNQQLRTLSVPSGLQRRFESYVAARHQSVSLVPSVADAQAGKDPNASQREPAEKSRSKLARSIGLKVCS